MSLVAGLTLYVFGGDFKKVIIDTPVPTEVVLPDSLTKDSIKL